MLLACSGDPTEGSVLWDRVLLCSPSPPLPGKAPVCTADPADVAFHASLQTPEGAPLVVRVRDLASMRVHT